MDLEGDDFEGEESVSIRDCGLGSLFDTDLSSSMLLGGLDDTALSPTARLARATAIGLSIFILEL